MDILDWIAANRPGEIRQFRDRIEVIHDSEERSTLWLNNLELKSDNMEHLNEIYTRFDGMDLFSSTFKIAAMDRPKSKNGVVILPTLQQIAEDLNSLHPEFPEDSIPFMYQAGIGFYAVGVKSGRIYEWDEEENVLSGQYESVEDILDEWLKAIA